MSFSARRYRASILSFPEANALAEVAEFLGISPEFYLESSSKTILYKNKAAKGLSH
jgi:hypothetical protein